jgi:uncharacterized repeat protein (TIGR03803 family)
VLHAFTGIDGSGPGTRLMIDPQGNIFGTTQYGGNSGCYDRGCGVLFELSRHDGTWTETVIHEFSGSSDGGGPESGPLIDSAGSLYGTTEYGGANDKGIAYKFTRKGSTWSEVVLLNFSKSKNVYNPYGELTFDSHEDLFGVAGGGQLCRKHYHISCGVVYELSPQKARWSVKTLFELGENGSGPNGGLLINNNELFGTATTGGVNERTGCCGILFELTSRQPRENSPGVAGAPLRRTVISHHGCCQRGVSIR